MLLFLCQATYTCGMTLEHAIKLAGSKNKLAQLLGITRMAVSQWKTIPEKRIWQLKVLRPEWFEVME